MSTVPPTGWNVPAGTQVAVPGWYPDPWGQAPWRYHDGAQWTPALAPGPVGAGGLDANRALRWTIPVGRTPLSIVAGYVALLSILLVFAPIALILGIAALVQLRSRPGTLGRGRAIFAIVMGGLFTAVLLLVIVVSLLHGRSG